MSHRFESHLTLDLTECEELGLVRIWAGKNDLKWSHILLEGGDSPSQPMITFRGTGDVDSQIERAKVVTKDVKEIGVNVIRVKVELELPSPEIKCSLLGLETTETQYYESHIKILHKTEVDLEELQVMVAPFQARLSRNARRQRNDGIQERFITQRLYDSERLLAHQQFSRLKNEIEKAGLEVIETEEEFVCYDSNLNLDAGWI